MHPDEQTHRQHRMDPQDRPVPTPTAPPSLPPISELQSSSMHRVARAGPNYAPRTGYPAPLASGSNLGNPNDESDPEGDQPPKKKRRRQALSCTECKRRKIKCDRAQPCGPCTRRGEQEKCQWHIIEPTEKYVTRGEYDELKARFERLESIVMRNVPPIQTAITGRSSRSSPGLPPLSDPSADLVQGTAPSVYHQGTRSSNPEFYHHAAPSPRSPTRGEPPPPPPPPPPSRPHRSSEFIRPHSPVSYRPSSSHSTSTARSTTTMQLHPLHSSLNLSPLSQYPRPRSESTSSTATSRRASLSLSAITTPFTPETDPRNQPKNLHAQTLTPPSLRLRQTLVF